MKLYSTHFMMAFAVILAVIFFYGSVEYFGVVAKPTEEQRSVQLHDESIERLKWARESQILEDLR